MKTVIFILQAPKTHQGMLSRFTQLVTKRTILSAKTASRKSGLTSVFSSNKRWMSTEAAATYDNILVDTKGAVGIITLNRPKALNALNDALIKDVNTALEKFDNDPKIGCVIITGR
jgi:hypothetical protein